MRVCVFYCERGRARVSHHRAAIGRENTRELLWDDVQEKQNNERGRERGRETVCILVQEVESNTHLVEY